ncbi:MAG: hypothetical protein LC745_10230, partial [Planctomycetia bacterium]|nr:hypothetical protein [Planctomycetia bacterium]
VAVRVADVPRFNPESIGYGPPVARPRGWTWKPAWFVAGVVTVAAATLGLWRARRKSSGSAGRLCAEVRSRLERARSAAERGRTITEGLIGYLVATIGRPPGALTPSEAGEGVARATGSDDLARRAFRLIADCDRALYDGVPGGTVDPRADGLAFFSDLAQAPPAKVRSPLDS